MTSMTIDLVIEGGGIKGIFPVGAAAELRAAGCTFARCAGTSAGAIVASLLAAGYEPDELLEILLDTDATSFLDGPRSHVGRVWRLWRAGGLHRGDRFREWIGDLLVRRHLLHFNDPVLNIPADLKVVASDITRGRLVAFPDDLVDYGLLPHHYPVATAVRASISIPYIFEPVCLPSPDGDSILVDGGLLSNFPVDVFDDHPRPTIGLRTVGPGNPAVIQHPIRWWNRPADLLRAMAYTATEFHDRRHVELSKSIRTIMIDNLGISPIDFAVDRETKLRMYESGRIAARAWLDAGGLAVAAEASRAAHGRVA
jgi:NTE family protein